MWTFDGKVFNPEYETILRNHWFGFIYIIKNYPEEKAYIGKKNFHSRSLKRKTIKIESDWRTYTGSSTDLTRDIMKLSLNSFSFEILSLHKTPQELAYNEIRQLYIHDVLFQKNSFGQRMFYNKMIFGSGFSIDGSPIPKPINKSQVRNEIVL